MYLQTLRWIILTFIEIICLSLSFKVNKTGAKLCHFHFRFFTTKLVRADSEASEMSVYKRWVFAGWSMERKNFYLTGKHKEQK